MNRQRTLDFFSKKRASTEVEQPTSNTNSTEIKASLMSALKKPKLDTISPIKTPVLKALPPKTYNVKIPFHDLAEVCEVLQNTPSRLSKLDQLESFFDKIIKEDSSQLDVVTNFLLNQLGPEYIQDLELGFGEHLIIKILQESFGYKIATLKTKLKEVGDLGQLTYKLRGEMKTVFAFKSKSDDVKISIDEAWKALNEIATISTHKEKIGKIRPLLSRMTPVECKFFVRFLEGKLRIGSSNQTIGVSMSRCMLKYDAARGRSKGLDQVEADRILRKVYSQVPNYSIIIDKFLEIGLAELETQLVLQPGIPLKPMLAKPCKSALDALAEFDDAKTGEKDKFICEYKYDGERIQFHQLDNGTIKIFSRNSEDMTGKYPELVDFSKFYRNKDEVKSLIIDGEIVAYDIVEDKILPFQILTTRKRKNVEIEDIKVKVCIYVFDILSLNGKSLLEETLEERRRIYMNVFESKKGELQFANNLISDDEAEISAFLDQSVQDKCEGLMVKALTGRKSFYQPASRSKFWMKLKKDYLQGVGDSLDLIIMGAYFGKGKRTGFYGGFLLGSYNPDNDEIETCCKIGTGFSDEHLELLHKTLKEYESDMAPSNYMYDSQTKPDIWFSQPKLLLEVLCADLSLSPVYKSAIDLTGNNRGISLRFPRMLRIRDDKDYTMATSSEQVLEMYQSQANLQ